jgi:hypothetical protein
MALRELFAEFTLAFPTAEINQANSAVDRLVRNLGRLDQAFTRGRVAPTFVTPTLPSAPLPTRPGAPVSAPSRTQAALADLQRGGYSDQNAALAEALRLRRTLSPVVPAGLVGGGSVPGPLAAAAQAQLTLLERLRATAGSVYSRFTASAGSAATAASRAGDAIQRSGTQADQAKASFGGLGAVFGNLGIALGLQQGLAMVTRLGSELETNKAVIAGMLQQFGKTSTFETGLSDAEKILARIARDSAALPGEADEYVEVFRSALPGVTQAMGQASVESMAAFTNRYTALGKSLRIDAVQLGNDLTRMLMLRGQAGVENRSFMQLLPFMRQVSGEMNLDATKFNAKSQQARQALIDAAINTGAVSSMIDKMSTSFDAIWGASKQNFRLWTRTATTGLFEGIKDTLAALNRLSDRMFEWGKRIDLSRIALSALAVGGIGALVSRAGGLKGLFDLINIGASALLKRLLLIALPVLLWDDFKTTIEGGDSVLRRFLVNSYGLAEATRMIANMRDAWASIGPALGQTLRGIGIFFSQTLAGSIQLFAALTANSQQSADAHWVAFNRATNGIERAFDRVVQYAGNAWAVVQVQLGAALAQMLASIDAFAIDAAMAFANVVLPGWDKISKVLFGADRSDMQKSAEQAKGDIELRRQRELGVLKQRFEGQREEDAENARRRQDWRNKEEGVGGWGRGTRFTETGRPIVPTAPTPRRDLPGVGTRIPTVPTPLAQSIRNERTVTVNDRSSTEIHVTGAPTTGEVARRVGEQVGIFRRSTNRAAYEAVAPPAGSGI